ncbi:hypothetical protein LINPERPRIM_LOCUS30286 [Linum perenne]
MAMPNRRVLCGCQEESVNRIFLHCSFSSRIWRFISSKLSISGLIPTSVREFISCWKGMNCGAPFVRASKILLHSFF